VLDHQERYFDWITPIVNALIGLLQILMTGIGAVVMQWVGFPMFNFVAPWLPLIVAVAFLSGVISCKRSPENIWVLAVQMNIPALLIGVRVPFFWVGTCLTVPVTAAGVAFGRKLFQRASSS
jgi:hypothetical protein